MMPACYRVFTLSRFFSASMSHFLPPNTKELIKGMVIRGWGGGLHLRNNLLVYSVEISSRSQCFTFQVAGRRWIYSGPILEVANEYTPWLIMLRLHHEETHKCVNGGPGGGGEFAAYCRALRILNFLLGSMRDISVRLL